MKRCKNSALLDYDGRPFCAAVHAESGWYCEMNKEVGKFVAVQKTNVLNQGFGWKNLFMINHNASVQCFDDL